MYYWCTLPDDTMDKVKTQCTGYCRVCRVYQIHTVVCTSFMCVNIPTILYYIYHLLMYNTCTVP